MDRYVNAAAVRAAIVKAREAALEHKPYGWEWENNGYNGAILAAGRVPAADVRPVVRGHWVYEEPNSANKFKGAYWCDQCHQPEFYRRNYCPNCGADMRPPEVDENA